MSIMAAVKVSEIKQRDDGFGHLAPADTFEPILPTGLIIPSYVHIQVAGRTYGIPTVTCLGRVEIPVRFDYRG